MRSGDLTCEPERVEGEEGDHHLTHHDAERVVEVVARHNLYRNPIFASIGPIAYTFGD